MHDFSVGVSPKVLLRKLELITFTPILQLNLNISSAVAPIEFFFFCLSLGFYFKTHFWKKTAILSSVLSFIGFRLHHCLAKEKSTSKNNILWIRIYHFRSAPKIILTLNFIIFHSSTNSFAVCVSPNVFFRKMELIIFGTNPSTKSEYSFPRGSNWRFFPFSRKLGSVSMCIPEIGSLLCLEN